MALPNPVIVVPGITASTLRDEYALPPETLWSMGIFGSTKEYERIALHPDNLAYETIEPARLAADQVLEVCYKELIEELRHNLREDPDSSIPVFPFAYDWRMPLDATAARLGVFVTEVIERTKLLRHYQKEPWLKKPVVNLVGHSMGGLVITRYLAAAGKNARVARVATLATPFQGSFESVVQIATGTGNLGASEPSSRERETARVTPALYHLLPNCRGLKMNGAAAGSGTLFKADLWQKSILDSLAQYVKLYAADPANPDAKARDLFEALLARAAEHFAALENFKLSDAGLGAGDWLCVAGLGTTTRVTLNLVTKDGPPRFEFRDDDIRDEWQDTKDPRVVQSPLTGDGTVPFEGAWPAFLPRESIVCVTPDDFEFGEFKDKAISKAAGFHGALPNMDMLHRLLVRFFTGRADPHRNTWGRRAPELKYGDWKPPLDLDEEPPPK